MFIGIRNKCCRACALGGKEKDHACFRNWDASSSEMETDIVLWKLSKCMEFITLNSLEMVTALFIQLSSLVFLDEVRPSRNLSVQITHANAIEAHFRSLSRIIPRIKAVGGSLKK